MAILPLLFDLASCAFSIYDMMKDSFVSFLPAFLFYSFQLNREKIGEAIQDKREVEKLQSLPIFFTLCIFRCIALGFIVFHEKGNLVPHCWLPRYFQILSLKVDTVLFSSKRYHQIKQNLIALHVVFLLCTPTSIV